MCGICRNFVLLYCTLEQEAISFDGRAKGNFFAVVDGNGRLLLPFDGSQKNTRKLVWSQRILLRLYGAQSDVM